jgi:ferrous iron transport protein B
MFFLALMFVVFQSIFVWATPLMDLIDGWFASLSGFVEGKMSPGPLRSLLTEGIIAGVGGVLVFLPQIMILFGFIAILEDCGYMARAAYLMDRLMRRCGLNGKSFIPLLSSTACAVPGILATRVIEQPRDRLATILVAPLMSCSARLPVYSLFIGAFFREGYPWWVPGSLLFAMYLIGFIAAPLVAFALKRTLLRGENPSFLLELPNFKRPSLVAILRRMWDAGQAFVVRAGTMILASMILIWAALYFPYVSEDGRNFPEQLQTIAEDREALETANAATTADPTQPGTPTDGETKLAALEELQARVQGEWKRQSYLGRLGLAMEPVFTPLGWDWKLGVAALASFPAREVMVGVFGMLYDRGEVDPGTLEDPEDESGQSLKSAVREQWQADPERGRFSAASALSIMVFFALCCQCVSTLAVIRRETRSWRWPIFTFVYMTLLAYVAAGVTYQVGVWYLS